jgi:CRISPR-associated endonuclease/helicase Cas3
VLNAVTALFGQPDAPTRLAESWLRFFGLARGDFPRFLRHLRVAAAAHDWGKANQAFQDAVKGQGEQVIRHEHLSGLLLAEWIADRSVLGWLNGAGIDEIVLLAAVISHHVKVGTKDPHALGSLMGKRDTFRLLSGHDDFAAIRRMFEDEVGPRCPVTPSFPDLWREDLIRAKSRKAIETLKRYTSLLSEDPQRNRWVGAIRAALIVADAVGSAVVRMEDAAEADAHAVIERWVGGCFSEILTGDEIWTKITKRRIEDLRERGRWTESGGSDFGGETGFSKFQVDLAGQGPRVLLAAPCGSGKTLAAWNWIKAQLDRSPAARVLFLYPTRATATEGFRDYLSWAPEEDAGLLSGTADYELRDMFETPDDTGDPRRGRDYRADPRLFALGHWKKRIFSATADQFFPFMQYQYGPICLLPLLAESILVVDEVHSFDESMFSTLRRFLRAFPTVPVLCMTATLPVERRKALIACGLTPHPEKIPADLAEDAGHPRYHVEWIDRDEAELLVARELRERRRVLWVSNRVSDCQDVYKQRRDDEDDDDVIIRVFCYHSRFKLAHRKERHKQLIGAFKEAAEGEGPCEGLLGATTQVCEMSLDLDAEVLVTELAPISSLIQRMGRCNRDSKKMRRRPIGRAYVLKHEDGKEKPYEKRDLDAAKAFVERLNGKDVSQDELEAAYKLCDPSGAEPMKSCPFLDSGPYAEAGQESFRDSDEFTVPCILDFERQKVLDAIAMRQPIDGFIVPVPRRRAVPQGPGDSGLPRWLSIADGWRYDEATGFDAERELPGSEGGCSS